MPNQVPATIPVLDPSGTLGDIPRENLNDALGQGYKVAQDSDIQAAQNEQQYGTPTEMLKTFGEGAANAATFGLARQAEKAANISPRGIIGREETNPVTYGAGELTGLLGTSALGFGEGAALESAGNFGAKALGLGERGLINKVGSQAVKGAIENALFQGGDEVAKNAVSDPSQTAGTAMANIGLSGLLGGGIGAGLGVVSPLWEATSGGRFKSLLDLTKNASDGNPVPMEASVQDAVQQAVKSGMEISPEIQASLSSNPEIKELHAQLLDSSTKPGVDLKAARDAFFDKVQEHALKTLGASPEYLESIAGKSDNALASGISQDIMTNLKNKIEPVSDAYEAFEKKAGNIPLTQEPAIIGDQLGKYALENRLIGRENVGEAIYNYAMKQLPRIKDVLDLKNLQQDIWGKVFTGGAPDPQALHYASDMVKIIRNVEQDAVMRGVGEKMGPEVLGEFNQARSNYSQVMQNVVDPLAARLNVGRYSGAKGFLSKLEEKFGDTPEKILRKLNPKDDANMISLLHDNFPEVGAKLRQYHSDEILSRAAGAPGEVRTKSIYKAINNMSPEMRNWLYTPEQQKTLQALETMRSQLAGIDHNFSGTAKAADVMKKHGLAAVMSMAAGLMGHSPIAGALVGEAGRYLTRDLPDAIKLGYLKFLGSPSETNPKGFASMVNYLSAVYRGEAKTTKAVKSLFTAGKMVLPSRDFTPENEKRIDERLKHLQQDPTDLFKTGNDVSHYMPEHGSAMAQIAGNAVQYLNNLRPLPQQSAPMDSKIEPGPQSKENYTRALKIAENPLGVLEDVKSGTLLPIQVQHLNALYPGLYKNLTSKIVQEMSSQEINKDDLPYVTKMGISNFLQSPLDSTMTPMAMQAIIRSAAPQQMPPPPTQAKKVTQAGLKQIESVDKIYQTPLDARAANRKS